MKKVLKIGAIVLGVFLALLFTIPMFLPSEMSVTETVVIDAPPDAVFDLVNDLRVFTGWISWGTEYDETMELEFSDPAVGEGAWYVWTGAESGQGKTTLAESERPRHLRMAIEFDQGKMAATNRFRFEPESEGRPRVSWELYVDDGGHLVHRYFLPLMEKMVGPFLAEGLTELKRMAESAPPATPEAPPELAPPPPEEG